MRGYQISSIGATFRPFCLEEPHGLAFYGSRYSETTSRVVERLARLFILLPTMASTLPANWLALLTPDAKAHLHNATTAAEQALAAGKHVFPPRASWFAAFEHIAPEQVRAVILGQDPYPTLGNAMGLAFSVPRGVKPPASLKNIYKALQIDLGIAPAVHGDLSAWAARGVLLLNAVLTVEEGKPNSHAALGWGELTDALIASVGEATQAPKAFLLWGNYAQKKTPLIDGGKHLILTAPHPSPLSARRGFFDCRPFSQTNAFLTARGISNVDWRLPP
ncbi:MAG: uracil-DNA glycosylase [Usitatibacteraceae bacterium]